MCVSAAGRLVMGGLCMEDSTAIAAKLQPKKTQLNIVRTLSVSEPAQSATACGWQSGILPRHQKRHLTSDRMMSWSSLHSNLARGCWWAGAASAAAKSGKMLLPSVVYFASLPPSCALSQPAPLDCTYPKFLHMQQKEDDKLTKRFVKRDKAWDKKENRGKTDCTVHLVCGLALWGLSCCTSTNKLQSPQSLWRWCVSPVCYIVWQEDTVGVCVCLSHRLCFTENCPTSSDWADGLWSHTCTLTQQHTLTHSWTAEKPLTQTEPPLC